MNRNRDILGRFCKAKRKCWVVSVDNDIQGVYYEKLRAEGVYNYFCGIGGFSVVDLQESEVD